MTDYRALAERLDELGKHAKRLHDQAYDTDLPENGDLSAAADAILALLEERGRQAHAIDVFRQNLATLNTSKNEQMARATLSEARLGKAVEALRVFRDFPNSMKSAIVASFKERARETLSELEQSE